jgi:hypothetical protein
MLVCAFSAPYYTGRSAGGVEASMGAMAFVSVAELAVNFGVGL